MDELGLTKYLNDSEYGDAVNDWVYDHGLEYYITELRAMRFTEMSYVDWCDDDDLTTEAYIESEGK